MEGLYNLLHAAVRNGEYQENGEELALNALKTRGRHPEG